MTTCTQNSEWIPMLNPPEASIRYGFSLNPWLQHLLPTSVNTENSFKFPVNENFSLESVNSSVLDE